MGFINLLKNGYRGKLGETVGQQWKNQLTVRTYQATNNSKSEAQLDQRAHYKEIITQSSLAYPSRNNFPKSPEKSMNDFNYYTRITENIEKEGIPATNAIFTGIFNKRDICHPTRYYINSNYFFFTPITFNVTQVNIKDYKLIIISNLNTTTGKYMPIDIDITQAQSTRQFKQGRHRYPGNRGILWRIDGFPPYNGTLLGAFARKKGSKWEYSGIFNLRNVIRSDWTNFEAPVPPITIIK